MSEQFSTVLLNAQHGRTAILDAATWAKPYLIAGHKLSLTIKRETRSTAQNRLLWSLLTDLANQLEWAVDGSMVKLEPEEVKDILTAGLKKHQRMCRGIDGGLVFLGQRTSRMTVAEMADLITLAHAYGDQQGVRWSKTSLGRDWPEEVAA
jgi:hypothetical protein